MYRKITLVGIILVMIFGLSISVFGSGTDFVYDVNGATVDFTVEHPLSGADYTWRFGDEKGITTSTPVVAHTYEKSGNYEVKLIVERCGQSFMIKHYVGVPSFVCHHKAAEPCYRYESYDSCCCCGAAALTFWYLFMIAAL